MTNRVVVGVMGIRDFDDQEFVKSRIEKYTAKLKNEDASIKGVITTDEKGSCAIVRDICAEGAIPCKVYQADWDGNGKAAGMIRNEAIVSDSQRLIVFWDGECPYLKAIIAKVLSVRKLVQVIRVDRTDKSYYVNKERPRTEKQVLK